jgi:hypothetical protein
VFRAVFRYIWGMGTGLLARTCAFGLLLTFASATFALSGEGQAQVSVQCSKASAFVHVSINSFRRIGVVTIEVRDERGVTLYKEEGKAMTGELVRRLDKGGFPPGSHTMVVTARDIAVEQVFTVE